MNTGLYYRQGSIFNKAKKSYVYEDIELLQKSSGTCFGELGLIYPNQKRTTSAVALRDTDLFSIEKAPFLAAFGKAFTRSEIEKKGFILSRISGFKEMKTRFDNYYRHIVPAVMFKIKIGI